MEDSLIHCRALVTHAPIDGKSQWSMENINVPSIKADELLIRIVASGICHTDNAFALLPEEAGLYPRILGHEGAGYVEKVGADVQVAKVGDAVLLSFASCNSCKSCKDSHPAYCPQMATLNYPGEADTFCGPSGPSYRGKYFGQSSFASYTTVLSSSVVNVTSLVRDEDELKMFAPLGCGLQTGAGAVTNIACASNKDSITITGLGGVGLASLMAAKISGCKTIICVDRFDDKLELAKSLGATHVINTANSDVDVVEIIRSFTDSFGSTITVDTTGNMNLIRSAFEATAFRGQMVIVGVPPPDAELSVHMTNLIQSGKQLRGCIEGDTVPAQYIPQMIQWYREGRFSVNRIVKYYQAQDYQRAFSDMKDGTVIKPILIW